MKLTIVLMCHTAGDKAHRHGCYYPAVCYYTRDIYTAGAHTSLFLYYTLLQALLTLAAAAAAVASSSARLRSSS